MLSIRGFGFVLAPLALSAAPVNSLGTYVHVAISGDKALSVVYAPTNTVGATGKNFVPS